MAYGGGSGYFAALNTPTLSPYRLRRYGLWHGSGYFAALNTPTLSPYRLRRYGLWRGYVLASLCAYAALLRAYPSQKKAPNMGAYSLLKSAQFGRF